jgi:hypothetical protein
VSELFFTARGKNGPHVGGKGVSLAEAAAQGFPSFSAADAEAIFHLLRETARKLALRSTFIKFYGGAREKRL